MPLPARVHVACHQVVALARGVKIGPVVGQRQVSPKAAVGLLPQPVNLRVHHVGRANRAKARVVDERDHLLHVAARHRHLREGRHRLKILKPLLNAVFDIAVRLIHCLSAMHQADQPPLVAVYLSFVMLGLRLHHVPVQRQCVKARSGGGANRQQPNAMLASQLGAGG